MKDRKTREVVSALKQKGFVLARNTDHEYYEFKFGNKKTGVHTKVSHGNNNIPKSILSRMAQQIKISNSEFDQLIECPFSKEDLISALREKNII